MTFDIAIWISTREHRKVPQGGVIETIIEDPLMTLVEGRQIPSGYIPIKIAVKEHFVHIGHVRSIPVGDIPIKNGGFEHLVHSHRARRVPC